MSAEIKKTLELRFRHKQPEIWTQAFDANRRVWIGLYVVLAILGLSFALNIVQAGRPANVILVDKLGEGFFYHEAASPEPPQNYEAKHFAEDWLRLFLSRDAITAKDDLARALTLTHQKLQERIRQRLVASGDLDRLRDAMVHTTVRCTEVTIVKQGKDRFEVDVVGQRIFTALDTTKKQLTEPFRFHLVLDVVARAENTPNGLVIRFLTGKWGSENIDETAGQQPG